MIAAMQGTLEASTGATFASPGTTLVSMLASTLIALLIGTLTVAPLAARAQPVEQSLANAARCAGLGPPGPGQVLTLDALIVRVVCHYPTVRRGDGLASQAQALLERSQAASQPSLGLFGGIDAQAGSSTGAEAFLNLNWILFDFGARSAAAREARSALAATLDEQHVEVLNAVAEAAQLYGDALAAAGRVEAASRNLQTALDSLQVASARAGGGAGTLAEKLLAQSALSQARLESTRARNLALTTRGSLAVAMGLPASSPIVLPPPDLEDSLMQQPVDLGSIAEQARDIHPSVIAGRERLMQARARVDSLGAERWGSVGLSAQTGRVRYSGESKLSSSTTAVLGWTLPIFDREGVATRVREAQGQAQVREAEIEAARQRVELQVWREGRAMIGERDALSESGAALDSAEAALRVVSARYREGVGRFSDLLAAQSAAANARFQVVEARANVRRAQLRLAAALGRLGPLVFE